MPRTTERLRSRFEKGKFNAAAAGALIAVAALSACGPSDSESPRPPETTSQAPSPEAPQASADPLESLNLPVTIEQLREMSAEELRALSTISLESVTNDDGSIDWEEVVRRTYENFTLHVNAGATAGELNYVANQGLDFGTYFVDKYAVPLESGYTSMSMTGLRAIHNNTLLTAELQNLSGEPVNVRTIITGTGAEVIQEGAGGAVVRVNERITDNFFSSGVITPDKVNIIENLGRDADANLTSVMELGYSIVDGKIVLSSNNTVG